MKSEKKETLSIEFKIQFPKSRSRNKDTLVQVVKLLALVTFFLALALATIIIGPAFIDFISRLLVIL